MDDNDEFDSDDAASLGGEKDNSKSSSNTKLMLPNTVWSWDDEDCNSRVTARVQLLSGGLDLNKDLLVKIHPGGRKATLNFKGQKILHESAQMRAQTGRIARYERSHAKIVAFEKHCRAKRLYATEDVWWQFDIALPFACEEELCTLEGNKGMRYTGGADQYRELEIEFMGIRKNYHQAASMLTGAFEDLSSCDPDL